MLQLLGLLLKAIITIAIGIMGFTWEPKEEISTPEKKDKHGDLLLPVYLASPSNLAVVIDASTVWGDKLQRRTSGCKTTASRATIQPSVPPMPKPRRASGLAI